MKTFVISVLIITCFSGCRSDPGESPTVPECRDKNGIEQQVGKKCELANCKSASFTCSTTWIATCECQDPNHGLETSVPAQDRTGSAGKAQPQRQLEGRWRISSLGQAAVPENANLTLSYQGHGDLTFFGGCNTLVANPRFGFHDFRLDVKSQTKKACKGTNSKLETELFDAITKVDALTFEPSGAAAFLDKDLGILFAAIRTK